jgi:hypothetical protein
MAITEPDLVPPAPWPNTRDFEAIAPHNSPSNVHPAEFDADGLGWFLASRGQAKVYADLQAGIRKIDEFILEACGKAGNHLEWPRAHKTIQDLTRARQQYARFAALAGLEIKPMDELARLVSLIPANYDEDVTGVLKAALARAQAALGAVDDELEHLRQLVADDRRFLAHTRPRGDRVTADFDRVRDVLVDVLAGHDLQRDVHGFGGPNAMGYDTLIQAHRALDMPDRHQPTPRPHAMRGGFDLAIDQAAELFRRKLALTLKVEELTADIDRVTGVIVAGVKEAYKLAGGEGAVVTGIRIAMVEGSPEPAESAELTGIKERLKRRERHGIVDCQMIADLTARAAHLEKLQAHGAVGRGADFKTTATALARAAKAGEEPARSQIERIARRAPVAFANGFVEAIAVARFDRHVIAALAAQLEA